MGGMGEKQLPSSSELNAGIAWILEFKPCSFNVWEAKTKERPTTIKHVQKSTQYLTHKGIFIFLVAIYKDGSNFLSWLISGASSSKAKRTRNEHIFTKYSC